MQVDATEVIGFVSEKMGISADEARKALCITDRETVIEIATAAETGRYQHIVAHDLDTGKVDLERIAGTLGFRVDELETYVEDHMIWIVYGGNIVDGIVGEGPDACYATADFYREWYKEKVIKNRKI